MKYDIADAMNLMNCIPVIPFVDTAPPQITSVDDPMPWVEPFKFVSTKKKGDAIDRRCLCEEVEARLRAKGVE